MVANQWAALPGRILALREKRGWSQQKLAQEAGASLRVVAKYEKAVPPSGPDHTLIGKLAEAFGITPKALLYGDGDQASVVVADDAELPGEMVAGLAGLGVVPTRAEVRWLSVAPDFKNMDVAGAFQALMGARHGSTKAQERAKGEAKARHGDREVPPRRK